MEGPILLLRLVMRMMMMNHIYRLKDESLQNLVGYDHYFDSRPILDPLPPPAPGSIFLLFLQYLSLTETDTL